MLSTRLLLLALLALPSALCAAATQTVSDPKAVTLALQAIAALTGGKQLSDVTLTGTVTWSAGSTPEIGSATLLALGTGESRMDFLLPSGKRTEIRDSSSGMPRGKWVAQSGESGYFADYNCSTNAVWFFPALSFLTAGPSVTLVYVGQETRSGLSVQHLQSYVYQSSVSGATPTAQQLSTVDFYLETQSFLPVAMTYNAHPDANSNVNMPVEIDFLSYQVLSGLIVPTHIQRSLQGNVIVDLTITSAAFNTGLPLTDFTIN